MHEYSILTLLAQHPWIIGGLLLALIILFARNNSNDTEHMAVPDSNDIAHQYALLAQYRRTLAHLLIQAAQYGGLAFAPPQTANGIYEARAGIQHTKAVLRSWGIIVDDYTDDIDPSMGMYHYQNSAVRLCKLWALFHSYLLASMRDLLRRWLA